MTDVVGARRAETSLHILKGDIAKTTTMTMTTPQKAYARAASGHAAAPPSSVMNSRRGGPQRSLAVGAAATIAGPSWLRGRMSTSRLRNTMARSRVGPLPF